MYYSHVSQAMVHVWMRQSRLCRLHASEAAADRPCPAPTLEPSPSPNPNAEPLNPDPDPSPEPLALTPNPEPKPGDGHFRGAGPSVAAQEVHARPTIAGAAT